MTPSTVPASLDAHSPATKWRSVPSARHRMLAECKCQSEIADAAVCCKCSSVMQPTSSSSTSKLDEDPLYAANHQHSLFALSAAGDTDDMHRAESQHYVHVNSAVRPCINVYRLAMRFDAVLWCCSKTQAHLLPSVHAHLSSLVPLLSTVQLLVASCSSGATSWQPPSRADTVPDVPPRRTSVVTRVTL